MGIRPFTLHQFAICQFDRAVSPYAGLPYEPFRHDDSDNLLFNFGWLVGINEGKHAPHG